MAENDAEGGNGVVAEDEFFPSSENNCSIEINVSDVSLNSESTGLDRTINAAVIAELANSRNVNCRLDACQVLFEVFEATVIGKDEGGVDGSGRMDMSFAQEEIDSIFRSIRRFSYDFEVKVRCVLMKELAKVVDFIFVYELPLKPSIKQEILPILLRFVSDEEQFSRCMLIRRQAYSILKECLYQNAITEEDIVERVSFMYKNMTSHIEHYFILIAAGNFIVRIAPLVSEEVTEKLILPKVKTLTSSAYAKVREASVHYLVDLVCFVDKMVAENILIPLFIKLCGDEAWFVRKACVETFVALSSFCVMESRKGVLARAYTELLGDDYKFVSSIAYKHLGPLITTFSQPALTGVAVNVAGYYTLVHSDKHTFCLHSRDMLFQCYESNEIEIPDYIFLLLCKAEDTDPSQHLSRGDGEDGETGLGPGPSMGGQGCDNQPDLIRSCLKGSKAGEIASSFGAFDVEPVGKVEVKCKDVVTNKEGSCRALVEREEFNQFNFWKPILPSVDLELSPLPDSQTRLARDMFFDEKTCLMKRRRESSLFYMNPSAERDETLSASPTPSTMSLQLRKSILLDQLRVMMSGMSLNPSHPVTSIPSTKPQQVVPQPLLDSFTEMCTSPSLDTKKSCAYTLPAVLMTLGSANWPHLKAAYDKLSYDAEWKLRDMIANSITMVAAYIGLDQATQDLVPVYASLLNDNDNVRITALGNLANFMKLIKDTGRGAILPLVGNFTSPEVGWMWRHRKKLAKQLMEVLDLLTVGQCSSYISPIAFDLLADKVAEVRLWAVLLMANLVRIMAKSGESDRLAEILSTLEMEFVQSKSWLRRQVFAHLCSAMIKEDSLGEEAFARDVLHHLLELAGDSVTNVRIAVARVLSQDVVTCRYFKSIYCPHHESLKRVMQQLMGDIDEDVRHYAASNLSQPPLPIFEKCFYEALFSKIDSIKRNKEETEISKEK